MRVDGTHRISAVEHWSFALLNAEARGRVAIITLAVVVDTGVK